MIEEKERHADPIDAGSAQAETWLADAIAEHRYALEHAAKQFGNGRCRNCNERLDDSRAYCDEFCRNDHANRLKAEMRRGRA